MYQRITMLLLAAFAFGLSACKKEPVEPIPTPVTQQPSALPASALFKQIKWAETDHLTATYDVNNRVSQLRSQWQFVQNDPTKIRSVVYDFQYDAQGKVTRITHAGGLVINLYYNGQLVEKAQELLPSGAVMNDFTYLYNNKRIIGIIRKFTSASNDRVATHKYEFEYDNRNNLSQIKILELLSQPINGNPYKLLETTTYSNFDDKVNTTYWHVQFPYLPQVRWQFNNPRRKEIKVEGGSSTVYNYTYTYNAQGLPTERRESVNDFVQTASITY
jgi:YD repeat-containing protein